MRAGGYNAAVRDSFIAVTIWYRVLAMGCVHLLACTQTPTQTGVLCVCDSTGFFAVVEYLSPPLLMKYTPPFAVVLAIKFDAVGHAFDVKVGRLCELVVVTIVSPSTNDVVTT